MEVFSCPAATHDDIVIVFASTNSTQTIGGIKILKFCNALLENSQVMFLQITFSVKWLQIVIVYIDVQFCPLGSSPPKSVLNRDTAPNGITSIYKGTYIKLQKETNKGKQTAVKSTPGLSNVIPRRARCYFTK